jgi:hypothetical protein
MKARLIETYNVTFIVQEGWGGCAVDSDAHVVGTHYSFRSPPPPSPASCVM